MNILYMTWGIFLLFYSGTGFMLNSANFSSISTSVIVCLVPHMQKKQAVSFISNTILNKQSLNLSATCNMCVMLTYLV